METKVKKNQTATTNKYSYKYVDIAQIHDYLESINARYIQQIKRIDNDDYIMTKRCFDNVWEDEWLQGSRVVDATLIGNDNPAQKQGSALTYARRYSLLMAFGLATEDDDAQSLSIKVPTKEDAEKYVFEFGKHKGKSLKEVIEDKADYIDWLLENSKDAYLLKCIELLSGQRPLTEEEKVERDYKLNSKIDLWVKVQELAMETNTPIEDILNNYHTNEMTEEQMQDAIKILKKKRGK